MLRKYASVVVGSVGCVPGAWGQRRSLVAERDQSYCSGGRTTHRDSNHDVILCCGGALPAALRAAGHITHSA